MQSLFSYTFSTFSDVVHELEPKKRVYEFLVTSGCLLSRKVLWAVRIGSLWPKIEVFYRPEWTKGGTTWKLVLTIKFLQHKNTKQAKTNWQNKNKRILNNKGNNFLCTKNLEETGKSVILCFSTILLFSTSDINVTNR